MKKVVFWIDRYGRIVAGVSTGVALMGAGVANAALDAGIQTAIDAASANGVSLTNAIALGLAAFVLLAKAFGKFGLR